MDNGHDEEELEELEPKAVARAMGNYSRDRVGQTPSDNSRESLGPCIHYTVFSTSRALEKLRTDTCLGYK